MQQPTTNTAPLLSNDGFQPHQATPIGSNTGMDNQPHPYQHQQQAPRMVHHHNQYPTSQVSNRIVQQAPPVNSGVVPNSSYSNGCIGGTLAFRPQLTANDEPLRPIARAPLQVLRMDEVPRTHQPVMTSSSTAKYVTTHNEKVGG